MKFLALISCLSMAIEGTAIPRSEGIVRCDAAQVGMFHYEGHEGDYASACTDLPLNYTQGPPTILLVKYDGYGMNPLEKYTVVSSAYSREVVNGVTVSVPIGQYSGDILYHHGQGGEGGFFYTKVPFSWLDGSDSMTAYNPPDRHSGVVLAIADLPNLIPANKLNVFDYNMIFDSNGCLVQYVRIGYGGGVQIDTCSFVPN